MKRRIRAVQFIKYTSYLIGYDAYGNETYYEDDGYWSKSEFDANGNTTYYENSRGEWFKGEYDKNSNRTYYENYEGIVRGVKK